MHVDWKTTLDRPTAIMTYRFAMDDGVVYTPFGGQFAFRWPADNASVAFALHVCTRE